MDTKSRLHAVQSWSGAVAKESWRNLKPEWTRPEIAVFAGLCAAVFVLAYLYCFRMYRLPGFDEAGLYNPIYTYIKYGEMTYPAYGHSAMYVHPPTHYWITAEFMKYFGLDLFDASAMPTFLFTIVIAAILFTGRFQFHVAIAALLAVFCGLYIWSDFGTIRPDSHVAFAWIASLLMLTSAKNCDWSHPRLFLGAFLATFSATLHYWGTVAVLAAGVFALWFLLTTDRSRWQRGLEMIAAGSLLAGGLYFTLFFWPQYDDIRQIASSVQGDGTWRDAFDKHLQAYRHFNDRLSDIGLPHLLKPQGEHWTPRWLVDNLTRPIFAARVPAIFVAVPLLLLWRQTRALAAAAFIVPAFVLFYSQGKYFAYTGYFAPEIVLYLFAAFLLILSAVRFAAARLPKNYASGAMLIAVVLLSIVALREVPVSMKLDWHFRDRIDELEVNRAAGSDIVGRDSVVATTSIVNWYFSGASISWYALNELAGAETKGLNFKQLAAPADVLVENPSIWWAATRDTVPLKLWYSRGDLNLLGFTVNESDWGSMNQLFYSYKEPGLRKGYFISENLLQRFQPQAGGAFAVATARCTSVPAFAPGLRLSFVYPVDTEPGKPGDQLALIAGPTDKVEEALTSHAGTCTRRDMVPGRLETLDRSKFRDDFLKTDATIRFATKASDLADRVKIEFATAGTPLALEPLRALPSYGKVTRSKNSITIETDSRKFAYAAELPLKDLPIVQQWPGNARIDVELAVTKGTIGIGVTNSDGSAFLARAIVGTNKQPVHIVLNVPDFRTASSFIVQSWDTGSGKLELRSITLHPAE